MSRPTLAFFEGEDTAGRRWRGWLLGPESEEPCCGFVLPEAIARLEIPQELADPFGPSRVVDFDMSDTPIPALAGMMTATGGPGASSPPAPPAGDPDHGKRGD